MMVKPGKSSRRSGRKTVAVICPTIWDADELSRIEHNGEYKFIYWPLPSLWTGKISRLWLVLSHLKLASINRFINTSVSHFRQNPVDGVIGTDDYLGTALASAIAEALGLPSPSVKTVLTCQHKFYSRLVQQSIVPQATPKFDLIKRVEDGDEATSSLPYPLFAKPVRGTFSILAQCIENSAELSKLVKLSNADRLLWYLRLRSFNSLINRYTQFSFNADYFIAEELLTGYHVSLEGFCSKGETHVIGILDSFMYEGTQSFRRFEYPSRLPRDVQNRMEVIAKLLMPALHFDNGLFEIEMYYNADRDQIRIVEVNPRMCPQFADLFEKVDGINPYGLLLGIATGSVPTMPKHQGQYGVAASFVIRSFKGGWARRFPNEEHIRRAQTQIPDARIRLFYKQGDHLSSRVRQFQDMSSVRLAVINIGGADRRTLMNSFRSVLNQLPFEVEPSNGFDQLLLEVSK